MEYKKFINLLDNPTTQPSKCKTKYCFSMNDDTHGTYNINSQF